MKIEGSNPAAGIGREKNVWMGVFHFAIKMRLMRIIIISV